ncbi:HlyD family efflux transporter periplasmic adaptor subunit [Porphyromonadaceae bacterium W3.11]|nr:HlyD family efflux transporter periplasmic adaptor subunit [Porphyromonadaceae bacterium W3.11]
MDRNIPKEVLRKEKNKKLIKFGAIALVGIGLLAVILIFLRPSISAMNLKISTVIRGTIEVSVSASGQVKPSFEEIVIAPINSRIEEVLKRPGDTVEVGTPILKLDLQSIQTDYNKKLDELQMRQYKLEQLRIKSESQLSDSKMQLEVNELQLDKMKVEVRNERYLDSIGAGTTDKVRETELKYNVAQLEQEQATKKYHNDRAVADAEIKVQELDLAIFQKTLSEVRRTLEDAAIRAPRAGVLTFVSNEIGSQAAQGSQVAIISDLSHFRVEGQIADSYADRLYPGARTLVRIGRDELKGVVSNITPLSKGGVIQFTVQLEEDDHEKLRSGLKTDVYVMTAIQEDVMMIDKGSYYSGPGKYELFVKNGEELFKREVQLGDSNHKYVEVVSGLKEGDLVVVSDMSSFKNRSKLKISK